MSFTSAKATKYNSILFRSRMEARWAIFFDMMDIKYEYEPDVKGVYYIPDFYLPQMQRIAMDGTEMCALPMYVEVKNEPLNYFYIMSKYKKLVKSTGCGLLYLDGLPSSKEYWAMLPEESMLYGLLICPDNWLRTVGLKLIYQHEFCHFEGESYPWHPFAKKYSTAKSQALGHRDWKPYSREEWKRLEKRRKRKS